MMLQSKVWQTRQTRGPVYIVKLLDQTGAEAAMCARLLGHAKHVIPATLESTPHGTILLMPPLEPHFARPRPWTLETTLDVFVQVLEVCDNLSTPGFCSYCFQAVQELHNMRIAHLVPMAIPRELSPAHAVSGPTRAKCRFHPSLILRAISPQRPSTTSRQGVPH